MKLTLDEDYIMLPLEVEVSSVSQNNINALPAASIINQLIKGEWDAVELYNEAIMRIKEYGCQECIDTINDIVAEEYVHIGQLEKLLQQMNPVAEKIKEGEAEQQESAQTF